MPKYVEDMTNAEIRVELSLIAEFMHNAPIGLNCGEADRIANRETQLRDQLALRNA